MLCERVRWHPSTARWWSIIHYPRERISTAPESNSGKLYITPADAWHCDHRLVRGWAAVARRRFHFIIAVLTIDRGSSSKAEIWQTDLLERWHPMTAPRWQLLSSSVYSTAKVWLWRLQGWVLDVIHLSAMGVTETTNLKVCPHTFGHVV